MLAYIFWHWPRTDVGTAAYENALVAFHQGLGAAGCAGFQRSFVFRVRGALWTGGADRSYADWYVLDSSAALDPLNEAAVAAALAEAHERCARAAAGGAGGLYRLRGADPAGLTGATALWLSKPLGMAYPDFYARLAPLTEGQGSSLWRRQMVLGPSPEFCLLSATTLPYPPDLAAVRVQREIVYA